MRTLKIYAVGAIISLTCSPLKAELANDFQTYLLQHHYAVVRTDSDDVENHQSFEAQLNGKKANLMIDTGAQITIVTAGIAQRAGLKVWDTGKSAYGAGGKMSGNDGRAQVASFKIGNCEINRLSTVEVFPKGTGFYGDGLFGLDSLRLNGAILPVGGHGFLIKPGSAPVMPIDAFMIRRGFTRIPMELNQNRLVVQGSFNGQPFIAQIDSGAAYSIIETGYLKSIHTRDPQSVSSFYMEGVDGRRNSASIITPKQLILGGFNVPSMMLTSTDSPYLTHAKLDALLGYDLLALHRAVIDMGSNVLWMN